MDSCFLYTLAALTKRANSYLFVEKFCCHGKAICNGSLLASRFFAKLEVVSDAGNFPCKALYQLLTEKFPPFSYIQYHKSSVGMVDT